MQQYTYKAKDTQGNVIEAEIEAASVADAAKLLSSKQLFPLSIENRRKGLLGPDWSENLHQITSKDKVLFTRQLATLVKAGLPLARALRVLVNQTSNPKMVRMIHSISNSIEGGNSLSKSLAAYPKIFNGIYISMVEAGEVSGDLDETLLKLASQEEKTQEINRKIRGAFTYPVVVLAVLIGVSVLMITVVLPQVGKIYTDLGKEVPTMTQILLGIAAFLTKFWYLIILMVGGLAYGAKLYIASPKGRRTWDLVKLNLPAFKTLIRKMYMARFARTLGSLISSGVPVLQALNIVGRSMNNTLLEQEIVTITSKVKSGVALSQPISESPLFLPLVGQMMNVGEQTGTMGDSLNKVANYYEEEVDDAIKNISTLIEPITMVVLGGMVAFLIAAVLLPIYGLVNSIH